MKKIITNLIIAVLATTLLLAGCSTRKVFKDADLANQKTSSAIDQAKANDNAIAAPVVVNSGYYIDTNPIDMESQPAWLKNKVSITGQQLPFSFLVSHVLRNTNIILKYSPEVQKSRPVSINYNGTIKGALETLASKTGYAYNVTNQDISWAAFVSKTFNIAFMPGTTTYLVGQSGSGGSGSGSSSSSSSSSSGTTTNTNSAIGSVTDQQYSGLQGTSISIWTDLKNALNELKSPEGKIYVSESTTSVTVYDHPNNVDAIDRYIAQLNKDMSQQVKLKVQVLELTLDQAHNLGVNWNLVQAALGGRATLISNLAGATNVAGGSASTISQYSPASLTVGTANSYGVLQALSMQGKLSVVTEPTVTTMNNQVSEIRITTDKSYLASVQLSMATSANASTTATMTPGSVTSGFTLYLLPKIKDNQIYLQISSTLATLESLDTFETPLNTTSTTTQTAKIQVPTVSEKRFNMRTLVQNGSTLVIGGFRQKTDNAKESKLFGMKALGGEGAQSKNVETILLITPTITEN